MGERRAGLCRSGMKLAVGRKVEDFDCRFLTCRQSPGELSWAAGHSGSDFRRIDNVTVDGHRGPRALGVLLRPGKGRPRPRDGALVERGDPIIQTPTPSTSTQPWLPWPSSSELLWLCHSAVT